MNARQRRRAVRTWLRQIEPVAFGAVEVGKVDLTPGQLSLLDDYSLSVPTSVRPGRTWRANLVVLARHHVWSNRLPPSERRRLAPPTWLRARWAVGTIVKTQHTGPDHAVRFDLAIRWERVRVVPGPARSRVASVPAPRIQFQTMNQESRP